MFPILPSNGEKGFVMKIRRGEEGGNLFLTYPILNGSNIWYKYGHPQSVGTQKTTKILKILQLTLLDAPFQADTSFLISKFSNELLCFVISRDAFSL